MEKTKILIVGGYGTVGSVVSEILAKDERIALVIAGRNESKASAMANKLGAEWRTVDVNDEQSISSALVGVDVVVNCFGGPFTNAPAFLAEYAAKSGIHYMDLSGSYEFTERFLKLNDLAVKNKATLITALGSNPGIPGIAVMSVKDEFDTLESGKIVYVLGAGLEGISAPSLMELKHMFDVKPLVWSKTQWIQPKSLTIKEYVGKPFDREIHMSPFITRDLLVIPEMIGLDELSFLSGTQFMGQGLVMILGLSLGLPKTESGARFLLNVLKRMGKSKEATSDALIRVEVTGKNNGARRKRIIEMYCEENYVTALVPAIVCQQLVENKITRHGAFVPPEIVPAADFMERLAKFAINYSAETVEN